MIGQERWDISQLQHPIQTMDASTDPEAILKKKEQA